MTYEEVIAEVAESIHLDKGLVDKVYRAYWRTMRDYIASRSLKSELTEEEFKKMKPSVNIPSLGKLYVTYNRYRRITEVYNEFKNKRKENATY